MQKFIFMAISAAALVGCASTPAPIERQKDAPAAQVFYLPSAKDANPAVIKVSRDESFVGAAVFMRVSLNGKELFVLNPAEYKEFKVDPGDYLFSAIMSDPLGIRHPATLDTTWRAGTKYSYRIGIDEAGTQKLFRVPE